MPNSNYESDFYAWANEQAALLRGGKLSQADIEHIAEEIESMGKGEKRELLSRLTVLLLHLLKWRFQPGKRGSSWETSIRVQRNALARHFQDNPSLRPHAPKAVAEAYVDAVLEAADETGVPKANFPIACPWSIDQLMDADYWPE